MGMIKNSKKWCMKTNNTFGVHFVLHKTKTHKTSMFATFFDSALKAPKISFARTRIYIFNGIKYNRFKAIYLNLNAFFDVNFELYLEFA